jgi:hypothetical protein
LSFSYPHGISCRFEQRVFSYRNVSSVGYTMAGKAGYWLAFYDAVSYGRDVKRIDVALLGLCILGVAFIGLGIWLETVPGLMLSGYFFVGLGIFGMVRIDTALVGLGFLGVAFIGLGIWLESFPELLVPGYVFIGLGIFGMVITFSRFFWHRQNIPDTPDQSN